MRVDTNEKFAAHFLSRCRLQPDVPDDGEIEDGVRVARRLIMDMGHWPEWLGTLTMNEIQEPGLVIYVTAPTLQPAVLDAENEALAQKVNDVFNALLLQGVPRFLKGLTLGGANAEGRLEVRQYTGLRELWTTWELPEFVVGMPELRRAVRLSRRLRQMQDARDGRWGRLVRGVNALLKANRERNDHGDRLHQFVRALEALVKPRMLQSRGDFAHRGQTFAVASTETREILLQLYDVRSHVEHVHAAMDALEGTREERIATVNRRTRQVDVLARFALLRVLESDEIYETFSADDQIDAFWRLLDDERVRRWGQRVEIRSVD